MFATPWRRLGVSLLTLCLAIGALPFGAISALAVSPNVVISQVYGGGGNAGATFTHDFVELYNRGAVPVTLSNWSIQYASASGTGGLGSTTTQITEIVGPVTLAPGQYFLIQEASTAAVGAPLPSADLIDSSPIPMSVAAGKVALVIGTTALGCNGGSTPCNAAQLARVVDLVGYGNANFFEGSGAAPTLTSTTAAIRNGAGATDTDNNSADFTTSTPTPRNSQPGDAAPTVTSTSPSNGATSVPTNANVSITFSEAVTVTGPWSSIACPSGTHPAAVTGGPITYSLDPAVDFTPGESCTVTINGAKVSDQDVADPPDTMAANYGFSFTVANAATRRIREIQGATHLSPYAGTDVITTGIVTAKRTQGSVRGFWIQDPSPDTDEATSEGVFVFTGSSSPTVTVGDSVMVTARIVEFGNTPALTLTELTNAATTVLSTGNPLPAPTIIGIGGRMPPTGVIDDDGLTTFDPANDGIDFYESLEGMRVQVNNAVAVGPTNLRFGELWVIADGGVNATGRTPRGGIVVSAGDFNPERILLDDEVFRTTTTGAMPGAHVGATLVGPQIGVVEYAFSNFRVQLAAAPTIAPSAITREVTRAQVGDELAIATFNVENLDANEPQSKFDALAAMIVTNLSSPDVITLEEIQDNDGAPNPSPTTADQTFARLIAAISAIGGPTYEYRQIDPLPNADGGEPGGNIRVAFLFRTDRGLSFVDAPGGDAVTANSVTGSGIDTHLAFSPGRIEPTNAAFTNSRKPLAGEFRWRDQTLFLIGNHFNSKGGDQPLFGRVQPPVQTTQAQRQQQAAIVNAFVDQILAADPQALIVVLGDINDFHFSGPMDTLRGSPPVLEPLMLRLPENERYSYVFEGNSQSLDHILVSTALGAKPLEFDAVHVNSEFYDQLSDHDPQVVRISLPNLAPTADAGGPYTVAEGAAVTLTASGSDPERGAVTYAWDVDNDGTFETAGQTASYSADDGPVTRTVRVRVTDEQGQSTVDETTVSVSNVAPTAEAGGARSGFWGLPVTFDGSATDPSSADSASLAYAWSFGGTTPSATTTFAIPGTHTVTLQVTDKDGGSGSDTTTAEITKRASSVSCTADPATYGFPATVHGNFRDRTSMTNAALAGRSLTFALGATTATAITDTSGNASAALPNTLAPGAYQVTISFAADALYEASTATCSLTIHGSFGRVNGTALLGTDWSASFHASADADGAKGNLQFRRGDLRIKAKTITAFGIVGDKATISGTTEDGRSFTLYVEDNGDGATDVFRLSIGGVPQTGTGALDRGNIRITAPGDTEELEA